MATGVQGTSARQYHTQQTHYIRRRINGSAGNGTYTLGVLPAGANVLRISTLVRTAFSGGSPTIALGTASSGAAFFAAAGGPATTAGRNNVTLIATGSLGLTADTTLTATIAGGPTAGVLDVEVEFTIDNDA